MNERYKAPSSPFIMRLIRIMTVIFFICFVVLFSLILFFSPQPSQTDELKDNQGITRVSFDGEIITLSSEAPEATHEAPWDDFGDAIPRFASQALLPLLNPMGKNFLMAPRPGTEPPLMFTYCDPFIPQPCDGVWIECPSVKDERETKLFDAAILQAWAKNIPPQGLFICDLDARGRDPITIQRQLKQVSKYFNCVYLWATGLQRWQIIASPSILQLNDKNILERFHQDDLFHYFQSIAIDSPWVLFAGAFSNDIQKLTSPPPSTMIGAMGLVETFLPCYEPSPFPFSYAISEITNARKWRKEFYCTGQSHEVSSDPLILGIASIDYALADDFVQQHNFTEAFRLCQQIQAVAKPSVEYLIFTLHLAQRLNDEATIAITLQALENIPPQHIYYTEAFESIYQAYCKQGRYNDLIHRLKIPGALTTLPLKQQNFYHLEMLFLCAEHFPSYANLKTLHEYLRLYASNDVRTQIITRYGELLKLYGDARTPLRFLAALSETKQWPNFDALQLEKEH